MYQNYIFDLYGTLVDIHTNERKKYLWEKMALYMRFQGAEYTAAELKIAYGREIKEQKKKKSTEISAKTGVYVPPEEIEASFEELIPSLYQARGVIDISAERILDWAMMYRTISMEHLCLYEGAKELLMRLKEDGKNIYLLSNAQRLFTEPEMRALGIYDLFDAVYYSSDVGFVKPSRHFYGRLLTEQRLDPSKSVMVGNDDKADAWGAHDNGLDSIYVYTRQSPKMESPLPANCQKINVISEAFCASSIHFCGPQGF
ncbi:MAG: HAD family hydrolase [Lachnospiraceae bacterium]|nr:HAD family hydrolase [Lachnospiraceae bacterium]